MVLFQYKLKRETATLEECDKSMRIKTAEKNLNTSNTRNGKYPNPGAIKWQNRTSHDTLYRMFKQVNFIPYCTSSAFAFVICHVRGISHEHYTSQIHFVNQLQE